MLQRLKQTARRLFEPVPETGARDFVDYAELPPGFGPQPAAPPPEPDAALEAAAAVPAGPRIPDAPMTRDQLWSRATAPLECASGQGFAAASLHDTAAVQLDAAAYAFRALAADLREVMGIGDLAAPAPVLRLEPILHTPLAPAPLSPAAPAARGRNSIAA